MYRCTNTSAQRREPVRKLGPAQEANFFFSLRISCASAVLQLNRLVLMRTLRDGVSSVWHRAYNF